MCAPGVVLCCVYAQWKVLLENKAPDYTPPHTEVCRQLISMLLPQTQKCLPGFNWGGGVYVEGFSHCFPFSCLTWHVSWAAGSPFSLLRSVRISSQAETKTTASFRWNLYLFVFGIDQFIASTEQVSYFSSWNYNFSFSLEMMQQLLFALDCLCSVFLSTDNCSIVLFTVCLLHFKKLVFIDIDYSQLSCTAFSTTCDK